MYDVTSQEKALRIACTVGGIIWLKEVIRNQKTNVSREAPPVTPSDQPSATPGDD